MALNVAIIGCGKIADGHLEQVRRVSGASVVAVCDREPIMAEQLAVRYGVAHHYSDVVQMLDAEKIDVVHITTPPQSHLELARTVVERGCHVFMEKPLAINSTEAERLIDAVVGAGRKLTINYWPNFEEPALRLRQLVGEGAIGDVVHVESNLGYNLSGAFGQALLADPGHWVMKLPGKLFQNVLDHILNKITPFLPSAPTAVHAWGYRRDPEAAGELLDELRVLLRSGPVSAYATLSSGARPVAHWMRVYGTRNTLHVDFNARTLVTDREQRFPGAVGRLAPAFAYAGQYLRQGRHNVGEFARSRFHYFAGMHRLISLFYASLQSDAPLPISYPEMLRVSRLMDDIFAQVYPGVAVG